MYKGLKNTAEITTVKIKPENLDSYSEIKNRVFICKKDVYCKDSIFVQGSPVFLELNENAEIEYIYDISTWNGMELNYKECRRDLAVSTIPFENLSKYFEYSYDLTVIYDVAYKKSRELIKKCCEYNKYDMYQATTIGWSAAAIIMGLIFLMYLSAWLKYTTVLIIALTTTLLAMAFMGRIFYYMYKHSILREECERYIWTKKQDFKEYAYRYKNRAACCQTSVNDFSVL